MSSLDDARHGGEELEIEIAGLTLAAIAWGPPDGKPVLAGHGWLDNAASFARLAPRLGDCRVVAIDFPGHGRSQHRPPGSSYHFVDWVSVCFEVADQLGWQSFCLMGHSMGAAIATLAAGTFAERVDAMVLLDGVGSFTTPPEQAPEQLAKALRERRLLSKKSPRTFDSKEAVASVIAETHSVSVGNARLLVERGTRRVQGRWQLSYDLALRGASLLRLTEDQVLAFLRRIACSTLLIRPQNGWPMDVDQMQRRIDAVDSLRLERVEGNHHVHLQHPERVENIVRHFLEDAL